MNKIKFTYVLSVSSIVVAFAILLMLTAIFGLSNELKNDGIRINMMGRQRMLMQQMVKEALLIRYEIEPRPDIEQTMKIFEESQAALTNGGRVPKRSDVKGFYSLQADKHLKTRGKLMQIINEWRQFETELNVYMNSSNATAQDFVTANSEIFLTRLDAVVNDIQDDMQRTRLYINLLVGGIGFFIVGILALSLISVFFELRKARERIDTLEQLLPICSSCKKIRIRMDGKEQGEGDHDWWMPIEQYLHEKNDMSFSHGLCPDCAEKLYPEIMEKLRTENKKKV